MLIVSLRNIKAHLNAVDTKFNVIIITYELRRLCYATCNNIVLLFLILMNLN